jgi:hypothetical protein
MHPRERLPSFAPLSKSRRKAEEPVNVTRVSTAIQQNINLLQSAEENFLRRAQDNMQEWEFWQVEKFSDNLPRVIGLRYYEVNGKVPG